MFIKEAGYIEIICYAKQAGINIDDMQYPQAKYTDDEVKSAVEKIWNSNSEEYMRLMNMADRFGLYPAEVYFVFLSLLPLWDSRFGDVFTLFGGIDGMPTEILARDMWEKNHKEKAIVRDKILYRFFIEKGHGLKPKSIVSSYLSGIYENEVRKKHIDLNGDISPRAIQIFESLKDVNQTFLFYGQKGIGKKTCFELLSQYKGYDYVVIDNVDFVEHEMFLAVVYGRAVALCKNSLISATEDYLPYIPFYVWIFEQMPTGIKACPIFFSPLNMREKYNIWKTEAKKYKVEKWLDFQVLANQYNLTYGEIRESFYKAESRRAVEGKEYIDKKTLYSGVHDVLNHQFESRAKRVECRYTWDDLVLSEKEKSKLQECCFQVSLRHIVMEKWELGRKNDYGGITVMFYGPPGTGKTMAAQVIASQLGMELYKAELSAVVSKFVGETEKNLKRIFEDASKSQAILFFDEADALFGKRTEVKDSHDKYSNMEAAFLLQEMERYNGVVILATNFVENIDEAFKRRMKFIIEFHFPSADERRLIWEKAVPEAMPIDNDVDFDFLAEKFQLTGSGIKNAVYSAAFIAAANKKDVGMKEFILAVKREYEKTGKLFSVAEAGIYSDYIKQ